MRGVDATSSFPRADASALRRLQGTSAPNTAVTAAFASVASRIMDSTKEIGASGALSMRYVAIGMVRAALSTSCGIGAASRSARRMQHEEANRRTPAGAERGLLPSTGHQNKSHTP